MIRFVFLQSSLLCVAELDGSRQHSTREGSGPFSTRVNVLQCGAEVRRQPLSLNLERLTAHHFGPRPRYRKVRERGRSRESWKFMLFIRLVFLEHRNWNGWHGLPARSVGPLARRNCARDISLKANQFAARACRLPRGRLPRGTGKLPVPPFCFE